PISAGRNAELSAEIFCKTLGTLELSSKLARAECLDARGSQVIDDAGCQRRLRSDHDKVDRVGLAERDDIGVVRNIEGDAFRFTRDAGIARRAPELRQKRRGGNLPCQRV